MAALILRLGALLALPAALPALKVGEKWVQLTFFQEWLPSHESSSGEEFFDFDGEEVFYVDWAKRTGTWGLPESKKSITHDVQGYLGNIGIAKNNVEVAAKRNWTQSQKVPPSAKVYPRTPVEMGDPNILVCLVDRFSPPVLNITWEKNGQPVSEGVEETTFYPSVDATFRKFSYLPFIPEDGDVYTCQVEHWGLEKPLQKIWGAKGPTLLPETPENVLCVLGLAVGIVGIVTGTVLSLKALRMKRDAHGRGPI